MSDKLFKVGTLKPRIVGEQFPARPVAGGPAVMVEVVKLIIGAGVVVGVICKLVGG